MRVLRHRAIRLMLSVTIAMFATSSLRGDDVATPTADEQLFADQIQPLLQKYCHRCHNADQMKSGIRVDQLTAIPTDRQLFLWKEIQEQIDDGLMPPEKEPQLTPEERKQLSEWITRTIIASRKRETQKNGSVRRLTVAQYRNTLRDLLGLQEDLTDTLPPDAVSKDGFLNNGQAMTLSPQLIETYFEIAEKALDLCLVDENAKPAIQNFRMDLGKSINPHPLPEPLVLGALSHLLHNPDFKVTELSPQKPFAFQPFPMRTHYEFIEGYAGNDTVRGWRTYDSIYHSVFACMRGTPGYPKGEAFELVPEGLLLRPAIPSTEIFGQSNTYGPMANFKISLRELPESGNFRVTVKAARYDDGLLLDALSPLSKSDVTVSATMDALSKAPQLMIPQDGVYQIDIDRTPGGLKGPVTLNLGDRQFTGQLFESAPVAAANDAEQGSAFLLVRLPAGPLPVAIHSSDDAKLIRVTLNRLSPDSDAARRFLRFEQRAPWVGVHVGLRRDCGSTLTRVGTPQKVADSDLQEFTFTGAINDFPSPDVEKDNVNYLAGLREIGVRCEYTEGRDMPRLLIRSVEFEGPFYESWPPATHRNLLIESSQPRESAEYAREVLRHFATKAFRRPITDEEESSLLRVWQQSFDAQQESRRAIKDALLVVLTSPQFLFLIEESAGPEAEDLSEYELASKLSYFLWNTAPDQRLLDLAAQGKLRDLLDSEIDRMLADSRTNDFIEEFAAQWLSLDKFEVVSIDSQRFPRLTRDAKVHLRREPVEYLKYLIRENQPLRHLIDHDVILADEVVAGYYGLGDRTESGFQFLPIRHDRQELGGVLTQAAILSGLSDGREANPVKRGAWVARKIVAEPPDDPPPNVPKLPENDVTQLTLREKLERHRNQEGCAKCHRGIDPWGLPFESYDAAGLFKAAAVDSRSELPDGTTVPDLRGLKAYLANDRLDQVAFSVLKHLATYATGRSLGYNDLEFLREQGVHLRASDYRMQDLIRFVVRSDLFLKK